MSAFRALIAQREARAALAVWTLIPAVFLFFALTLAVDPTAHLDRIRLGVTSLDAGVVTPEGQVAIGPRLVEGLRGQVGAEVVEYATEAQLREAVLAHDVAAAIVVPADMTRNLQAGRPAELRLIRSDANDPFTNSLTTNLATQLAANIGTALPPSLGGAAPDQALVSVVVDNAAATKDFRFAAVPAMILLPSWMASVAFGALLARAGDGARRTAGVAQTSLAEVAYAVLGAGVAAAAVTASIAAFTWRWDIDLAGLFGFLWLGLTAVAMLVLGTIRLGRVRARRPARRRRPVHPAAGLRRDLPVLVRAGRGPLGGTRRAAAVHRRGSAQPPDRRLHDARHGRRSCGPRRRGRAARGGRHRPPVAGVGTTSRTGRRLGLTAA